MSQTRVQSSSDWMVVESLDALISESPLIVIDEVRQPVEVVNMARNVEDVSEPDSSVYGLGQVYEVAVEQFLKGDGPSTESPSSTANQRIETMALEELIREIQRTGLGR